MTQSQQTYQRAAMAALTGLVVQLLLAVGMALVGLWAESRALHAATFHLFGGLPIWIILCLLYNQHRLERMEALESEELARTDARSAAMFDERADDLQLSRRRLSNLYGWGLGAVGAVVAVFLLAVGGIWLYLNSSAGPVDVGINTDKNVKALGALCVAFTFVAFIVARYVAGMTRVQEWQLLRGGASYLMGGALISVLSAVAAGLHWLEVPGAFKALGIVIPLLMVLLGAEIIISFLLGAYRPRRPGEIPRPAFDSRALGLLTSPESIAKAVSDAINYQFGFEISRSWFYQLFSRAITPLITVGVVVLLLISCLVIVDPHEQAVVTRFGQITRTIGPGLSLKLPWPISRAYMFPVARVHQISVGSVGNRVDRDTPILWTTEHAAGGEQYLITGATALESGDQSVGKAAKMALVAIDVIVQFRIKKLEDFVKNVSSPRVLKAAMKQRQHWAKLVEAWESGGKRGPDPVAEKKPIDPCPLLTAIANRRVNDYTAKRSIDVLLTTGRLKAGHELRRLVQEDVDAHRLGLEIVFVGVAGIHPPQKSDVAAAFHEQIGALQERQSAVEKARRESIQMRAEVAGSQEQADKIFKAILALDQLQQQESKARDDGDSAAADGLQQNRDEQDRHIKELLIESRGEAAEALYDAYAYRWRRVITERAEAHRYNARLAAYKSAPRYYKMRLYLDVLGEAVEGARKIAVSNQSGEPTEIRLELQGRDDMSLEGVLTEQ